MRHRPSQDYRACPQALTSRIAYAARDLDREADLQLALGHHVIAERLSRHAEELRESAQ